MDELTRFFFYVTCVEKGVLPLEEEKLNTDMNSYMSHLTQEEKTKTKRKFRKLWKKYSRGLLPQLQYDLRKNLWLRKYCMLQFLQELANKKKTKYLTEKSVKAEDDSVE